jgi:MSHA pilin protein MshD
MMEEILLKPYTNPTGGYAAACPTTCNRALFDNVGDYAGYSSTGVFSLDDLVTVVAGLNTYNVSVAVTTATVSSVTGLQIVVTVTVSGNTYTLTSYRFNYD